MPRILIIDRDQTHRLEIAARLRGRQLEVATRQEVDSGVKALNRQASLWDIVVVNVSDASQPWLRIIRRLVEACSSHRLPHTPLFLCTSTIKRDHQFQLALERLGARFVYER